MGLTADLVSRLSRVGGLFVIARASSTRFSPRERDFPDIGQLLGVRYLIPGSLQSLGTRLRVSVELVEAATASAVWAEQFDYARDDLFLLQDELRPVRLQLELLKPELILQEQHIESTVVIYGSARITDPETAETRLVSAQAEYGKSDDDPLAARKLESQPMRSTPSSR